MRVDYPGDMRTLSFSTRDLAWLAYYNVRGFLSFLLVLIPGVYLCVLFMNGLVTRENMFDMPVLTQWGLGVVATIGMALFLFVFCTWMVFRRLKAKPGSMEATDYGFDNQALYIRSPRMALKRTWSGFLVWGENRRYIVLSDGMQDFQLPKCLWTEPELERLRTTLKSFARKR